jgi:hypothetical protein
MVKKHMKKYSPSLALKGMPIKTRARIAGSLTPVRMATIKNTATTNVGHDVGKKEPSYTAGGNVN